MNRTDDTRERTPLYSGEVEFTMVRHLLDEAQALISGFPRVMVSRVDGAQELPTSSPIIQQALGQTGIRAQWAGGSLVLSGSELIEMQSSVPDGVLQGHDEIWLFSDRRPVQSPPEDMTLIQGLGGFPEGYLEQAVPQEIEDWVLASGCVLGLADNDCDLTYATIDPTIASYLESLGEREG